MAHFDNLYRSNMGVFDALFDNRWVLSGSKAVKEYLDLLGMINEFDFVSSDVDIHVVSDKIMSEPRIHLRNEITLHREQSNPTRSMTFEDDDNKIDIDFVPGMKFINIGGLKVEAPENLLRSYLEDLDVRDNIYDQIKIEALRIIIEHPDIQRIPRHNISVKRQRNDRIGDNTVKKLSF